MAGAQPVTKFRSFVRLWWVALQSVDRAGLGGGERQPLGSDLLQLDKKALAGMQRLLADVVGAVEAQLIGKFADEGVMVAARAPQRDVGDGAGAMAEVELADVLHQLLDDALVDQRHVGGAVARDDLER